jgi:hypothetical protein
MTQGSKVGATLLQISAGPLVWFAHLNLLYAVNTSQCLNKTDGTSAVTLVATVVAIAVTAALAWKMRLLGVDCTGAKIGTALSALSVLAVLWTALAFASGGSHCG